MIIVGAAKNLKVTICMTSREIMDGGSISLHVDGDAAARHAPRCAAAPGLIRLRPFSRSHRYLAGGLAQLRHHGEQQRRQHHQDGDDDQQLDYRKSPAPHSRSCPLRRRHRPKRHTPFSCGTPVFLRPQFKFRDIRRKFLHLGYYRALSYLKRQRRCSPHGLK